MPFAVTHVLTAIIVIEFLREYLLKDKKNFPHYFIIIGGIASLLPDIDIILYYILYAFFKIPQEAIHRMLTHSLIWPAFFLIGAYYAYIKKNKKQLNLLIVITIGITLHIILDMITGYVVPLAPFSQQMFGLNLLPDSQIGRSITLGIDAIILIAWLIHEEVKHQISKFV
ncbi:MAG: metal-dependent hydrolase [Nanoarchaeota archaeon]|nr:metal-dependent hydrolase [Nanoarchaeota archaeon]MBU1854535.1 metal-dependent hydrolase [Nanoarchaeota archaeon]